MNQQPQLNFVDTNPTQERAGQVTITTTPQTQEVKVYLKGTPVKWAELSGNGVGVVESQDSKGVHVRIITTNNTPTNIFKAINPEDIYIRKAIPFVDNNIDLLYIPYGKRDYDGQTFWPTTRFHKEDQIDFGILDFHGAAFGGSPLDVGKVIDKWETHEGKWARVSLDESSPNYESYLKAAQRGELYCSAGAIQGYFSYDEKGNITDWATGEVSLIVADGTKRPKNWYAIAKPKSEAIMKAANIPYEPLFEGLELKKDKTKKDSPLPEDDGDDDGLETEEEVISKKEERNLQKALGRFLRHVGFDKDYTEQKLSKHFKAQSELEEKNKTMDDINDNPDYKLQVAEVARLNSELTAMKALLVEKEATLKAITTQAEIDVREKIAENIALKARLDQEITASIEAKDTEWMNGLVAAGKVEPATSSDILKALKAARQADNGGLKGVEEGILTKTLKAAYEGRKPVTQTVSIVPLATSSDPAISTDLINTLLKGGGYTGLNK